MSRISIEKISEVCLDFRTKKGWTQVEMAEILAINPQIYGKIERSKHLPKLEQIEKIVEVTGVGFASILEAEKPRDIFVALKGEAKNPEEKKVFDELIEMILCLDKHKNIREAAYEK